MFLKSIAFYVLAQILNIIDHILWIMRESIFGKEANPLDMKKDHDPNEQVSILVADSTETENKNDNEVGPFRNADFKGGKELARMPYEGVETIPEMFDYLRNQFPARRMLGQRKIINLVEEKVETYENNVKKVTTWKVQSFFL